MIQMQKLERGLTNLKRNKMKETLEEAAEKLYSDKLYPMYGGLRRDAFINGAKWQQERSYSEEEVLAMLKELEIECVINPKRIEIKEWFEQFKK